ncbi:MAG: tetratricopeptide repeat protein [Proteobacteria bacterium]|nr:tetratricopeptide repeat protein [Pseudomonadota bacterium]
MSKDTSIFEEIIARRIPHIIGMYIAGVWLSIEIADWMSDRFNMPNQLSIYVFVGMSTFIPSVVMLAWGHGRPGKDRWSKLELAWLPTNILLSVLAISYFIVSLEGETLPQNMQLVQPMVSQLPIENIGKVEIKNNNHHKVISFFWENKTGNQSYDWLSYGAAWLFAQDVKRTPNISASTPYESRNLIRELQKKGFERSLNIPLSLAIQMGNKFSKKWMVLGSFSIENNTLMFLAKLYNVETGLVVKELFASHENLLKSLDSISNDIGKFLLDSENINEDSNIIPDLAIQDHTSKNIEAIKYLISAKNHVAFENDYKAAIDDLLKALEIDNSFAEANVLATSYYQAQGDFENAIKQSKKALSLDYKIYQESVFAIKASLFGMSGDQNKAQLVLENWIKVFPTSPLAHATLARKYLFSNDQLEKAEMVFEKLLSLDSDNHDTLLNLGQIYRVQGEKQKSIEVLEKHLSANPDNIKAYIVLANAYKQFSMFDKAIAMFEQASIIGSDNYEAEIGIAQTIAIQGDYKRALKIIDKYLEPQNTDSEKLYLLNAKVSIYMTTGQITKAFELLEQMQESAKKILPPLSYLFSMDGAKVQLYMLQGNYQQALDYANILREKAKLPFKEISTVFFLLIYMDIDEEEKFEAELRALEQFLTTFPVPGFESMIPAWNAKVAYWQGNRNKSIELLDKAIVASKQSIQGLQTFDMVDELIYSKALIYHELKKDKRAQIELDYILNRNPIYAKAHVLKAKIFKRQGNLAASNEAKQKAMKIWQDADENFVDLKLVKDIHPL